MRPGGSKRAQDVPKTAEDGPKRAPRGPKMAPRGLQEGPSWPQESSKRAQDGPKGAPRGPKLAPRWLQEGPRWPTWLREPSRTLPGPSQTPPGSDFGTHFVPKTDPRRPKSLRKLCFPVGPFCDTGAASLGLSSDLVASFLRHQKTTFVSMDPLRRLQMAGPN